MKINLIRILIKTKRKTLQMKMQLIQKKRERRRRKKKRRYKQLPRKQAGKRNQRSRITISYSKRG